MDEQEKGLRGDAGHKETSNVNNISPDEERVNHSGGFVPKRVRPSSEPQDEYDADGFMAKLFSELSDEEIAYFIRAMPEPGNKSGGVIYPAYAWDAERCLPRSATHYCVTTGSKDALGASSRYGQLATRTKQYMMTPTALALDDTGTKAKWPELEPSFNIETKPGNHQLGYVFDRPCSFELYAELQASVIAAGLCDPAIIGENRLARLPGSLPAGKQHRAALREFSDRRFNPETLLDEFGIERVIAQPTKLRGPSIDGDLLPNDELLQWLHSVGAILDEKSGGWYQVLCPFAADHGSPDDLSGTHYKTPTPDDTARAFNCFHGGCRAKQRSWRDFLNQLTRMGAPAVSRIGKPQALSFKGGKK